MPRKKPLISEFEVYPDSAVDFVNASHRADTTGMPKGHFDNQELRLRTTLRFLRDRAAQLCGGDPSYENQKRMPLESRLWSITDYALNLLNERCEDEERELVELLLEGQSRRKDAERIAAMVRWHHELLAQTVLEVGVLAGELGLRPHSEDIRRGKKTLQSARNGHAGQWGTAEEKAARWAHMQSRVDEIAGRHPDLGKMAIYTRVADEMGCSARTVRNHTAIKR